MMNVISNSFAHPAEFAVSMYTVIKAAIKSSPANSRFIMKCMGMLLVNKRVK